MTPALTVPGHRGEVGRHSGVGRRLAAHAISQQPVLADIIGYDHA
ncbi:MAG TPA: hypothetical protein VF516_41680 [Kofleriaceae bacterium]